MRTILSVPGILLALPALSLAAPAPERLHQVPVGETIRIAPPDAAAAKRARELVLRRIDIYAGDATVRVVENGVAREIGRSTRALFATERGAAGTRGYLSVAADGGVRGMLSDLSGARALEGRWVDGALQLKSVRSLDEGERSFQCGGNPTRPPSAGDQVPPAVTATAAKGSGALQAVVAVDTDTDLLSKKFGDDTSAANDYIAELFVGMNAIFSTDLGVTLVLGDVFRSVGSDPYPSTSSTSTPDQLDEFGEHWRVTYPTLSRAFAAQLSGKAGSPTSASGIAWMLESPLNYCGEKGFVFSGGTFGHYSMTRVFWSPSLDASFDVSIVAHELGHNFGAAHTHCTDADPVTPGTQHIDQCYAGESGVDAQCYAGATSCPSEFPEHGTSGTLMSYCHLRPGCAQSVEEFHPVHQVLLDDRVAENVAFGCITAGAGGGDPDLLFGNGFE